MLSSTPRDLVSAGVITFDCLSDGAQAKCLTERFTRSDVNMDITKKGEEKKDSITVRIMEWS